MDNVTLYEIAEKHHINSQVFALFIKTRFPHEQDYSYVDEWATRFSTGTPQIYMDSKSREAYNSIIAEYTGDKNEKL